MGTPAFLAAPSGARCRAARDGGAVRGTSRAAISGDRGVTPARQAGAHFLPRSCPSPHAVGADPAVAAAPCAVQVGGVATHTGVAARLGAPQRARVSQQKARLRAQASGAAAATPLPGAAASESSRRVHVPPLGSVSVVPARQLRHLRVWLLTRFPRAAWSRGHRARPHATSSRWSFLLRLPPWCAARAPCPRRLRCVKIA